MAKLLEIRGFGALCNRNGLPVNGRTIYNFLLEHGFIEQYSQPYKGSEKKYYRVSRKYRHRTFYPGVAKKSDVSDKNVSDKIFVQIERIFDEYDREGECTTVFLTEYGVKFMLDFIKETEHQPEQLSMFFG